MPQLFSLSARYRATIFAALTTAIIAGCTYSHGDDQVAVPCENATTALASYASVVSPIFDLNCRTCHGATVYQSLGGFVNFSDRQHLVDYNTTRPNYILCCINHAGCDNMPKGGNKLSDCDIARIQAWFDAGLPNN